VGMYTIVLALSSLSSWWARPGFEQLDANFEGPEKRGCYPIFLCLKFWISSKILEVPTTN